MPLLPTKASRKRGSKPRRIMYEGNVFIYQHLKLSFHTHWLLA